MDSWCQQMLYFPSRRTHTHARTHSRAHWGRGPNALSAAEMDTGWKTSHLDKALEAVTSAAVTNWKRQKEDLIRTDFLSYKSGVTTQRQQVWAVHGFSEHQLCSLNGRCWELMTSRHIKLCRVLYQNWKCLQIGGWIITGSCIRNPLPSPTHYC